MADIIETIPFNFDEIYLNLEEKLSSAGYDTSEGSNTSQLITAMTYLTSMLNANTAVNINETLLTLATKRDNVLQASKVLGYQSSQKISYVYSIELELEEGDFILNKYTKFESNGNSYVYMGDELEINVTADEVLQGKNKIKINIKQGNLIKYTDSEDLVTLITPDENNNPITYVDVPYTDIEENGIEVFTQYGEDSILINEIRTKADIGSLDYDLDLYSNKQFVKIDNIEFNIPRIYLKIGDVGKTLPIGSIVNVNVLITKGSEGFIDGTPTSKELIGASIIEDSEQIVVQGTDLESIDSIKLNAPKFHNSANRAVTKSDYQAICNRHQAVKDSFIWDGNDDFYKLAGNIWFSFLPNTVQRDFIIDAQKNNFSLSDYYNEVKWFLEEALIRKTSSDLDDGVFDYLEKFSIPSLTFRHRHPVYFDFNFRINISKYNLITPRQTINNDIFNIINEYFIGDEYNSIERFNAEYFHSALIQRVSKSEYLSEVSGIDIALENTITLTKNQFQIENYSYYDTAYGIKKCYVPLAYPYEPIFDENNILLIDKLPNINTTDVQTNEDNFNENMDLEVIFTETTKREIISFPIYLDKKPIGLYHIISTADDNYIFLQFFGMEITDDDYKEPFKIGSIEDGGYRINGLDNDSTPYIGYYSPNVQTPTTEDIVNNGLRAGDEINIAIVGGMNAINLSIFDRFTFNVKYPTNNISFVRNILPRLKSVKFE